jgi:hypothetical protein
LEVHLSTEAVQLLGESSAATANEGVHEHQPEACWRLAQELLSSLQDTFPEQDRSSGLLYRRALQAVRFPWWFVGDNALHLARGEALADALASAPLQLRLIADALSLSRRLAVARSGDAPRAVRRATAGLSAAQVPLMAIEERLKVAHARAQLQGSPLMLSSAAPWNRVQAELTNVRRAVADLRSHGAAEHSVRSAARPLRASLEHMEKLVAHVLP